MAELEPRDYIVAKSQPRREAWAEKNITRQGRACYIPRYTDGKTGTEKPLWPSYLFVFCPDGQYSWLTGTFGVSHVLKFGYRPATIANSVIEALRGCELAGLVDLPDKPKYRLGQELKVNHGAFVGKIGLYQGMSEKGRVLVLMSLLGKPTQIAVPASSVAA